MNPQEDTMTPSLSIISPEANATVIGLVTITAEATANSNRVISNVNFFIDDVLKLSDEVSPWEYELYTFEYENYQISIKVIAYDNLFYQYFLEPNQITFYDYAYREPQYECYSNF